MSFFDMFMSFYVVFDVFSMYFKNIITFRFHRCLKMTMDRPRVPPVWLLFWFTILRQAGDLGWFSKDKDC